jgi:CheY-like chemotaxis protein
VPEPLVLRVLIVDDDPDMVRLLRHVLQAHGYPAPVVVRRGAAAAAAAAEAEVVLLDHQLPDGNGMELIEPLRSLPSSASSGGRIPSRRARSVHPSSCTSSRPDRAEHRRSRSGLDAPVLGPGA